MQYFLATVTFQFVPHDCHVHETQSRIKRPGKNVYLLLVKILAMLFYIERCFITECIDQMYDEATQ